MSDALDPRRRFRRIGAAGVFFQGGAAAIDSATVMAALVQGLTGSVIAVGAAAAIARAGWLVLPNEPARVGQAAHARIVWPR